jgi:predicted transcriptional regulator
MHAIYYRNRIDIIASILEVANGNEVKQVEILNKANITPYYVQRMFVLRTSIWINRIYTISENL